MKIKELLTHPATIIMLAILLVAIVTLIIINLVKNKQLKNLVNEYSDFYTAKEFLMKIDASRKGWKIIMYKRKQGISKSIVYLPEYQESIFQMDRGFFVNYIENCLKDKKLPKLTLRHISGPIIAKSTPFQREYSFMKKVGDVAYFRCQEFVIGAKKNQKEVVVDINEFVKLIKQKTTDSKPIQGMMLAFKVLSQDAVLSRYNIGIASQYKDAIASKVNSFALKEGIIAAQKDDLFYFYVHNLDDRKQAMHYLRAFKLFAEASIVIAGFKLSVEMNYGIAFLGEFSSNINIVISQSEQALKEAIDSGRIIDSFIYDSDLEQENIKRKKNFEKISRIISSRSFTPSYSPILDLEGSRTIGYRVFFNPDSHFFSFEEIVEYAKTGGMKERLNDSLANTVFSHFFFKKIISRDIIFVTTTLDECREFISVYRQNTDYSQISFAMVLTDYSVFKTQELDLGLMEKVKTSSIKLYAIAEQDMLLSNHPIFNYLDGIIFNSRIISLIEKDNLFKLEMIKINDRFQDYNYDYIAFDVSTASTLETVKSLGIKCVEGDIVAPHSASPIEVNEISKRKI